MQFIATTGNNRLSRYEETVGRHYCDYATGGRTGCPNPPRRGFVNEFFPVPGPRDYDGPGRIDEYRQYFELPGAKTGTSNPNTLLSYEVWQRERRQRERW